jgi:DNA-binding transcriptional LysR family regulator
LTPAGEALLPYARRCLALAEETVVAARSADGVPPFCIAVHATFAPRVVPMVLDGLADHPRRVSVRDAHSEDIAALVLDGVADVGFVIPGPATPGTKRVSLAPDPIVAVCRPDHPVGARRRPSVASLRDSLIAVNAWGSGADAFLERTRRAGIHDRQIRYCGDATTALALALDHDHVALVTESSARVFVATGLLAITRLAGLSSWAMHVQLLHRTHNPGDAAVRDVVARVKAASR